MRKPPFLAKFPVRINLMSDPRNKLLSLIEEEFKPLDRRNARNAGQGEIV